MVLSWQSHVRPAPTSWIVAGERACRSTGSAGRSPSSRAGRPRTAAARTPDIRQHGGSAGPLHFGKGSTWEGGVRVPGIFWWPGTIRPGLISELGATVDLWPTIVSLAGGQSPTDRTIDGVDLGEVLLSGGKSPRTEISYYREGRLYAYRSGPFKAHFFTEGVYGEGPPLTEHDPPLLYNLGDDPGERFDVAEMYPDVLERLISRAHVHREALEIAEPIFDR